MNPFVHKLGHGIRFTEEEQAILVRLAGPERAAERGDIVPQGVDPRSIMVIMKGWACRYKQLENGRRQITSLFVPGDLCEPFGTLPHLLDHTVAALSSVRLVYISLQAIRNVIRASPRIEEALWRDLLQSDARHREHLVSLGGRSATERLGHFFCEVHVRQAMVGLADGFSCEFPLTQMDLADLFGLSAVHVNRSIQELRGSGLISLRDRRLTIQDAVALRELSMFDPAYLELGNETTK